MSRSGQVGPLLGLTITKLVQRRKRADDGPRRKFGLLQWFVFFSCPVLRLIRTIEGRFQPFMHTLIFAFSVFSF